MSPIRGAAGATLVLLFAGVSVAAGHCQVPLVHVSGPADWVPDQSIRRAVAGTRAERVASFQFQTGLSSVCLPGLLKPDAGGVVVSDAATVALLLRALQGARCLRSEYERPYGSTGLETVDTITVHFRPVHGVAPSPRVFGANLRYPLWCFGPQFYQAVRSISESLAGQVRRFVTVNAKEIISADVDERPVAQPKDLAAIVQELEHVQGRAFAVEPLGESCSFVTLHLRGGQEATVLLQWVAGASSAVLPPVLRRYYVNGVAAPEQAVAPGE